MELQTAVFLSTIYDKNKNIQQVMETLDQLSSTYHLDRQLVLQNFTKYLQNRPDLSQFTQIYSNLLSHQHFPATLNLTPNISRMGQIFHPTSLTQCHQLQNSFTAIRCVGNIIFTASDDGAVKAWKLRNGSLELFQILVSQKSHKRQITNICANSQYVAVAWGSVIAIWGINEVCVNVSVVDFQLLYGVKKRNARNIKVDVKDNADQLYFVVIDSITYLLAQTQTSIYLLTLAGEIHQIFNLGWYEREDKQKITWAAYNEKIKQLCFVFIIRSNIYLGFVNLSTLNKTPYCIFYSESEIASGTICAGQIVFSSVIFDKVYTQKEHKIDPEVVQYNESGSILALTLQNSSALLLYTSPIIIPKSHLQINFSFLNLNLIPKKLSFQNMKIPAGLRADYPVFTVSNCVFHDEFLLCQLKIESKKFDKSYLVLFNCNTLQIVSRCVLQGTGSGIAVNSFTTAGDWFWVVSDAENTNKDRIENIELGARDTFVYLLRKDLGEIFSCCHIPNGQDESAMIFCDIQTFNESCFVSNAGGQVMIIGGESEAAVTPQEQFFMIELPAFRNQRFERNSTDVAEIPGKVEIQKCEIVESQVGLMGKSRSFNVQVTFKIGNELKKQYSEECSSYTFYGLRVNILRFLMFLSMSFHEIPACAADYFLGMKFLNQHNLHHNSYFFETIENIVKGRSPVAVVSMLNKVYDFGQEDRIKEFSRLQENVITEFWTSCKQQNSFDELNAQKSHYLNPEQIKKHGLLFLEVSCEFLVDQDSFEWQLKEGVNYKSKNEPEIYQFITADLKFPTFANTNLVSGDEGYIERNLVDFKHSLDPDQSSDDLVDESSQSIEESDESVVQEVQRTVQSFEGGEDSFSDDDDIIQNNIKIVSDNEVTESDSSQQSVTDIEQEVVKSLRESQPPKDKTMFQIFRESNWNYIQSFNSASPEMFNKDLQSVAVLQAGDVVYFNPEQYIDTVNNYIPFFNQSVKQMLQKCKAEITSQLKGIYIIQSIYTRFEDHIGKSQYNRKITWPVNKICIQDLILESFDETLDFDQFFTSNGGTIHQQNLYSWVKNHIKTEKTTLTISVVPLQQSMTIIDIHYSAGLYPLCQIINSINYQDIDSVQELYPFQLFIPQIQPFSDDVKQDFEDIIQLSAMKEIDKYSSTYKNPIERKFMDYYKMTIPHNEFIDPSPALDHQLCPVAFVLKKDGTFRKLSKSAEPPVQQSSELSHLILKNMKQEVIDYMLVFKPDSLEPAVADFPILAPVSLFSVIEILTQEDTTRFFNNVSLVEYLGKFYDDVKLNQLECYLNQGEIKTYNNQVKCLIQDQIRVLFVQSLSENKKLNSQVQQEARQIHILTDDDKTMIRTVMASNDLEKLTEARLSNGQFLMEYSMTYSEVDVVENTAFSGDQLMKSNKYATQYLNRAIHYFSVIRALQSSLVKRKQNEHIQNFFLSPQQIENYGIFIPTPVWINLILQRVNSGYYGSYRQLVNDLQVLLGNSDVFNANTDEIFVKQANWLYEDILDEMNNILVFVFGKDAQDIERCTQIEIDDAESRSSTEEIHENKWGDSIVASDEQPDDEGMYDDEYESGEVDYVEEYEDLSDD